MFYNISYSFVPFTVVYSIICTMHDPPNSCKSQNVITTTYKLVVPIHCSTPKSINNIMHQLPYAMLTAHQSLLTCPYTYPNPILQTNYIVDQGRYYIIDCDSKYNNVLLKITMHYFFPFLLYVIQFLCLVVTLIKFPLISFYI